MKTKTHAQLLCMVRAALFLALTYLLPFLTGQIPEIGAMLCPMHLPVLLCGFLCGWQWGGIVGLTAPLLRSLTLSMPPLYPTAVCMALELATYGIAAGLLYHLLPPKKPFLYPALLLSMVAGRLVWGGAMLACMGVQGKPFGIAAFLSGAVTGAIPGIVLQILLIPPIVLLLDRGRWHAHAKKPKNGGNPA